MVWFLIKSFVFIRHPLVSYDGNIPSLFNRNKVDVFYLIVSTSTVYFNLPPDRDRSSLSVVVVVDIHFDGWMNGWID